MSVRAEIRQLNADYEKTEDDLKAVQNCGQMIAEVLKQLDADRCMYWRGSYRSFPYVVMVCCDGAMGYCN